VVYDGNIVFVVFFLFEAKRLCSSFLNVFFCTGYIFCFDYDNNKEFSRNSLEVCEAPVTFNRLQSIRKF